jgi:hypothetical protein
MYAQNLKDAYCPFITILKHAITPIYVQKQPTKSTSPSGCGYCKYFQLSVLGSNLLGTSFRFLF